MSDAGNGSGKREPWDERLDNRTPEQKEIQTLRAELKQINKHADIVERHNVELADENTALRAELDWYKTAYYAAELENTALKAQVEELSGLLSESHSHSWDMYGDDEIYKRSDLFKRIEQALKEVDDE